MSWDEGGQQGFFEPTQKSFTWQQNWFLLLCRTRSHEEQREAWEDEQMTLLGYRREQQGEKASLAFFLSLPTADLSTAITFVPLLNE